MPDDGVRSGCGEGTQSARGDAMSSTVVIMRHAEKEIGGETPLGVTIDGSRDSESLTPRGWQRAGATVGLFVPRCGHAGCRIAPAPTHLVACRVGSDNADSRRPLETLQPLSERLGIAVDDRFYRTQLEDVAAAILGSDGPVLVAWEHTMIPALARTLTGDPGGTPGAWPDDRFDVLWVLEPDAASGRSSLRQVPQLLLAGDLDRGI
jgi:hypothetical protein